MDMDMDMDEPESPPALPEPVPRRRRPSLVWLIPLVAAVIGAWMALKAYSDRGPTITITFQSAEGLEAGQTRIRHKDVEVGRVTAISLTPDFGRVLVTAELQRSAYALLSENTRFWVVRARVSTNGISGLGTLLSGAYIGMDPGPRGRMQREFKGLESAPILTPSLPGALVELRAEKLGSLNIGSPVTYRQIPVGEVEGFDLDPEGRSVLIKVQVNAPYHRLVHPRDAVLGFRRDRPEPRRRRPPAALRLPGAAVRGRHRLREPAGAAVAAGSGPGLHPVPRPGPGPSSPSTWSAAPSCSTFRRFRARPGQGRAGGVPGHPGGRVEDFRLELRSRDLEARIPVLVSLEPDRFALRDGPRRTHGAAHGPAWCAGACAAQLRTGSLLTGSLFVDLGFFPSAPARAMGRSGGYPEIPTMPSSVGALVDNLTRLAERLQKLPLEEIAEELRNTFPELRDTLGRTRDLMARLDTETAPQAQATLAQAQATLAALERALGADSPTQEDLRDALDDFARAARALRDLADTLERHPESMIFGKGKTP